MAEPTRLRYRGDGPDALADALLRLIQHARESSDDFTFGPINLVELERDGLEVGGPDLSAVIHILATVPGIAPDDFTG